MCLGKTRSRSVCDSGIIGPPHSPWQTRKNTNMLSDCAKPHRKENSPNSSMAVVNTRTVPKRVASHPVSGTVMASATE